MDLREYLFRKKLTVTDFAKSIRYSPNYVMSVVRGAKTPGRKFKEIVEEATKGEVTFEQGEDDERA